MSASDSSLRKIALVSVLLTGAVACGHSLESGTYALTADGAPSIDTCKIAPADGTLWGGPLTITGEEVFLVLTIPVPGQDPTVTELTGFFKQPQNGQSDGFVIDGTGAQIPAPIPTIADGCEADTLIAHMSANISTTDDQHFAGSLHLVYDLSAEPPSSPCSAYSGCELLTNFKAALVNTNQ